MSDDIRVLILREVRALAAIVGDMRDSQRELIGRVGVLEEQGSSLSRRVDRVHDRLDRIERRLELRDIERDAAVHGLTPG